jgi:ribosomal protein S18 acetylase RimI-like enzyme
MKAKPKAESAREAVAVRVATDGDVPSLLDMMTAFNAAEAIAWSRAEGESALRRLLADVSLGVVGLIVEGAETRGYFVLTWGFDLEWGGRDAWLTELYLRDEARGAGIGAPALAQVEASAREHGARALHLMVRPENARAVRLYERAGFEAPPRVCLSKRL